MLVRIRGVVYSSVREAAEAFGVTRGRIYNAVRVGKEDTIGLGIGLRTDNNRFVGNRVTIFGVEFSSMKEASEELGFRPNYIRTALRRRSHRTMEKIRFAVHLYAARKDTHGQGIGRSEGGWVRPPPALVGHAGAAGDDTVDGKAESARDQ